MSIVKKTVSLSSDLVEEAQAVSSNFSSLVEIALRDYLQHYYVQKAKESFGKWQPREEASVDIINEMRKEEGRRRHVEGSH